MKASTALIAASVGLCGSWSTPTHACSPIEVVDTRWFATAAPVGGVWWVSGFDLGDTVHLTGIDGAADVDADVVSTGPTSVAIAVPEVPAGTRFSAPASLSMGDGVTGFELEVTEAPIVLTNDDVPAVDLRVELREVRQGYGDVAVVPFDYTCDQAAGWWAHTYGEGAFGVVDGVPEDLVLDMTVRPRGEPAFAAITSANQIVFDGDRVADVDAALHAPPGTDTAFTVHAQYRRIADGAVGPLVSIDIDIDPTQTERTEFVGCASGPTTPAAFAVLLLALRRRRR